MSRPRSATCAMGHNKAPGRECVTCKAERMARWYAAKNQGVTPEMQSKRESDARATDRRLEAVGRCQHPMRRGPCGLLLPCCDHDDLIAAPTLGVALVQMNR